MIRDVISAKFFIDQLAEYQALTGRNSLPQRTLELLYKKLHEHDIRDLTEALERMAEHDLRITYANFLKHIRTCRSERLEREHAEKKASLSSWSEGPEDCDTDDCSSCSKIGCRKVAMVTLSALVSCVGGEKDFDLVKRELDEMFPGLDFLGGQSMEEPF